MLGLCRQQSQKHVPDQAMIPFAVMGPEEGEAHNVFVDGILMSPGSEDYNLPPAPELVDQFRRFLDSVGPGRWPGQCGKELVLVKPFLHPETERLATEVGRFGSGGLLEHR
jgi:hypothetical protein